MIVKDAKDVARRWVIEEGPKTPGFLGAYLYGSATRLQDDAELSASSDVDIAVVLAQRDHREKLGKILYGDVILEISYKSCKDLESPDEVLGNYHLAPSLRAADIISDASCRLAEFQSAVSKDFAKRRWLDARLEHTRRTTLQSLENANKARRFHDQVVGWLFGAAGATHILLVAGLRDPTIRRRYAAARQLLSDYSRLDFHETLLGLQGSAQMTRDRVEYHLDAVTEAFDVAKTVVRTPYRFASDISDVARPISIDGSRELIDGGFHREAVYWIVTTYCRCLTVLHNDASPETRDELSRGFRELLEDLGITSFADLQRRTEQVKRYLPRIEEVAEAIIAANPEIED